MLGMQAALACSLASEIFSKSSTLSHPFLFEMNGLETLCNWRLKLKDCGELWEKGVAFLV